MKKTLQALSFLIIAMGMSGAYAVGEEEEEIGYSHQVLSPSIQKDLLRQPNEPAFDYVLRMNKIWSTIPKYKDLIGETLEDERKKQESKWNNASFFGKAKEVFMANPYDSTAAIGFTVLGYTMGWWVPQTVAIAFDIYTGTKNYALAKGSKKNLLFGIGFSWSPPA